jgi:hypothetical protein
MELIINKISINRGVPIWFRMFGATVWNPLIFFEKPILKTILEFGGILGIVGKPSPNLI